MTRRSAPRRSARAPAGTGLTPATSAPGLRSRPPHLHRECAHPCHICTGTGLAQPPSLTCERAKRHWAVVAHAHVDPRSRVHARRPHCIPFSNVGPGRSARTGGWQWDGQHTIAQETSTRSHSANTPWRRKSPVRRPGRPSRSCDCRIGPQQSCGPAAQRGHICTGTVLKRCHICTGTGLSTSTATLRSCYRVVVVPASPPLDAR